MDIRKQKLENWLSKLLSVESVSLCPVSGDASARRYFRFTLEGVSYIAVDTPIEPKDNARFVQLADAMFTVGLNVPVVHAEDLVLGFMLLSDLGEVLYSHRLSDQTVAALYDDAMSALIKMQTCSFPPECAVIHFDEPYIRQQFELLNTWYFNALLSWVPNGGAEAILSDVLSLLIQVASEQPQVFVHADYHSRNLLISEEVNPAIIDFQDAFMGPVTYDLASLLRDCYLEWPEEQVMRWVLQFKQMLQEAGRLTEVADDVFIRWFDMISLQRHLKVLGVFARLHLRDGKSAYLNDIPRVLRHIQKVTSKYPELTAFDALLETIVIPKMLALPPLAVNQ